MKAVVTGVIMAVYCVVILKLYLDTFLQETYVTRRVAGWLPFFVWQFFINGQFTDFPSELNLLLSFITLMGVGLISYEGSWKRRCMFSAICFAIWSLVESVTNFGPGILNGGKETGFFAISVLSKILMFFIIMGIRRFSKRTGLGKELYGESSFFIILPITAIVTYLAIYMMARNAKSGQVEGFWWLLTAALSLIMMNLTIYPTYNQVAASFHMKKNAAFYKRQLELFAQERELEEASAAEIRELRHDMKQELVYLNDLIQKGELVDALNIIQELIGKTENRGKLEFRTGNLAVDSLMNHAQRVAQEKHIQFDVEIGGLPTLSIGDVDLCVLLGNALDNALEASEYVPEESRTVRVFLNYGKGCLLLKIVNRYSGTLEWMSDGKPRSGKKDKGHGLGMYSMEKIVNKYQGRMSAKAEGDSFVLEILVYC